MLKRNIIKGLLLALIVVVVACAPRIASYDSVVNSWQGATTAELYQVWGYPNRIIKQGAQRKLVYGYTQQKGQAAKGALSQPETVSCLTSFLVDASNRVVSADFSRDKCHANNDFVKVYTRSVDAKPE